MAPAWVQSKLKTAIWLAALCFSKKKGDCNMEASGTSQNLIKEMQRSYYCYYDFSLGQQKTNVVSRKEETVKYEGTFPPKILNNWVFMAVKPSVPYLLSKLA